MGDVRDVGERKKASLFRLVVTDSKFGGSLRGLLHFRKTLRDFTRGYKSRFMVFGVFPTGHTWATIFLSTASCWRSMLKENIQ